MGYKILDRKNTGENSNGVTESICAIYCDSKEDLPVPANDAIAPGSWAWLADDETFATLKTDGATWHIDGGEDYTPEGGA